MAAESVAAARAMVDERASWERALPRHLVGLYAVLHEQVYGVEASDVLGDAWPGALSAATRLMGELGGPEAVVELLRWTWARERAQSPSRRGTWRVTWRVQFCQRSLVVDWKVAGKRSERPINGGR